MCNTTDSVSWDNPLEFAGNRSHLGIEMIIWKVFGMPYAMPKTDCTILKHLRIKRLAKYLMPTLPTWELRNMLNLAFSKVPTSPFPNI